MEKECSVCGKVKVMFSWEDTCFSCEKKKHQQQLAANIRSGKVSSTECEDDIFCPYCGVIIEVDDDYELWGEGEHEKHCGWCEKTFIVTTFVSHSFDTCGI